VDRIPELVRASEYPEVSTPTYVRVGTTDSCQNQMWVANGCISLCLNLNEHRSKNTPEPELVPKLPALACTPPPGMGADRFHFGVLCPTVFPWMVELLLPLEERKELGLHVVFTHFLLGRGHLKAVAAAQYKARTPRPPPHLTGSAVPQKRERMHGGREGETALTISVKSDCGWLLPKGVSSEVAGPVLYRCSAPSHYHRCWDRRRLPSYGLCTSMLASPSPSVTSSANTLPCASRCTTPPLCYPLHLLISETPAL